MENALVEFLSKYPSINYVLLTLGSLVVIMSVVVKLTPSKKDDAILDKVESNAFGKKVLEFLKRFSLFSGK